ncbi:MAG: hypothetical protein V3T17_00555 [Pseudomonadales bacterium]
MNKTQWQAHVDAYNNSGLSKRQYADRQKLVYHQFVYWSRKINNEDSTDAFIPIKVTAETQPQPNTTTVASLGVLEFPNGARLVIHSPDCLALLPSLLAR